MTQLIAELRTFSIAYAAMNLLRATPLGADIFSIAYAAMNRADSSKFPVA